MPARTTLPTSDEIDRLTEQVRRDPGSDAFVALGEAFLALSRPRDAIEVGARGLRVNPENTSGRLMVGRAFAMLHKWKEAQAELLKVVKADRHNGAGFSLLGEVLMRRADYDRALPVLQHAQNLNPADAQVLGMLRRAREGRPLEPPEPIPSPQQPVEAAPRKRPTAPPPPPGRRRPPVALDDDDPTRVAGDAYAAAATGSADAGEATQRSVPRAPPPPSGALGRMDLERVAVKGEKAAPRERGVRRSDDRGNEDAGFRVEHHAPPPPEDPLAPLGSEGIRARLPLSAGQTGSQAAIAEPPRPPAAAPPKVLPRVMEAGKKADRGEARKALRTSAAVGEQYLNNLLTNGMLDVPNVRSSSSHFTDIPPDKMWGRSSKRAFIALFVVLFMAIGSGAGYFFWQKKKTAEAVAAHLAKANDAVLPGTYAGLRAGLDEAMAALKRDKGNPYATAVWAELGGIDLLVYGEPPADAVHQAITTAARGIGPNDVGGLELDVARIAHELAQLDGIEEGGEAVQKLTEVRARLDEALQRHPDSHLLRWLEGVALVKGGDRDAARTAFERADANGQGPLAARIARADLMLDDGELDKAFELYDDVLARAEGHPWAYIGRSLARSERSVEGAEAVSDLNVGLSDKAGPRVDGWKQLALAATHRQLEDYEAFAKSISPAIGLSEPRYLARVALAHLDLGKIKEALKIRSAIRWASEAPQLHPLVATLDAELFLATGQTEPALAAVENVPGLGPLRVRGRALFDEGKYEEALAELDAALQLAPQDREAMMWREAARFVAKKSDRGNAEAELASMGRQFKAKDVRYVHGLALLAAGNTKEARDKLEQSLEELSDEYPNALAYRAHASLAELDLLEERYPSAELHLKAALAQNPSYLPAHGLMGRLWVRAGDPERALEHLADVMAAELTTAADELAVAEALVMSGNATDDDKAEARAALERAGKKGASEEEVARVAALIDPEAAKPEPKRRRRGR